MRTTAFVVALSMILLSIAALADVPGLMNYQGTLTDGDGVALDTTVSMIFFIYPDSIGGTPVWTETQPAVGVSSGIFNVLLGSASAIPDTVFDDPVRWLGIQVGGDPELVPRQKIASVGYAFRAAEADTAEYARSGGGGGGGGWVDDGTVVRLETAADSVGIGTAAPREKLEVKGDFRVSGPASTEKKIKIGRYWDDTNYHTIQSFYDGANSGLLLTTYLNGSIILNPSGIGNVGIGTTTPAAKLHVYDSGSGNYGYVGSSSYGMYGRHSGGNYGYMGGGSYCVLGAHTGGNWGYIGGSTYSVLGRLGLTTSPGNYAVYGIGASEDDDQGTGYDYPLSLGGVQGYNFNGNSYTFGVAGYSPLDSVRSGGCFGGKDDAHVWGCFGYKNSAGNEYGGYVTGSWAPSEKAEISSGIGFGSWGELFGADIHGKVYGLYAEGGNYGLYSHGAIFLDDLNVHLQRMEDKTTSVLFTNVSTDVTVQTSGFSTLSKGAGFIGFDEDFRRVVSPDVPIVVTVTPTGNCNGVHVSQVTKDGFTVLENNAGKSDVTVAFIAIGRRAGYENPNLPQEVVSPDYVSKLSRGLHNDADTQTDGQGLYFENGELHVGVHPSTWPDVHKVRDEIAPPEEIQPELPSAIPDLKLKGEERETSGRTPKVNVSGSKKRSQENR